MKKHLFTALLAIVAVGGAFAVNAGTGSKKFATTYYERISSTVCNPISCDPNFTGAACKQSFNLYTVPGCTGLTVTPPATYKRP